MSVGDIVVLAVVLVLVFFAARAVYKTRKSGGCSCGCGGGEGCGCGCGCGGASKDKAKK